MRAVAGAPAHLVRSTRNSGMGMESFHQFAICELISPWLRVGDWRNFGWEFLG
jgi:hypothetical protein